MKKPVVVALFVVSAILLTTRSAQTVPEARSASPRETFAEQDDALQVMQDQIQALNARVERLEARASLKNPTLFDDDEQDQDDEQGNANLPDRILMLDGVETTEPDPEMLEEVDRLFDEAEALERTVESKERSVASMTSGGRRGSYYSGRGPVKDTSGSRRRQSQGKLLADYKVKLRKKQGEAKRLQREYDEPKQIIHGHWGDKIISLRTTKDLSRVLDKMETGDRLTWRGRRLRSDSSSEEWVVLSIKIVEANGQSD